MNSTASAGIGLREVAGGIWSFRINSGCDIIGILSAGSRSKPGTEVSVEKSSPSSIIRGSAVVMMVLGRASRKIKQAHC